MSEKRRVFYMHTIEGKPAYFEGHQLVYASQYMGNVRPAQLVSSLAEIRRQQRASVAWRTEQGFKADPDRYSHIRVRLP